MCKYIKLYLFGYLAIFSLLLLHCNGNGLFLVMGVYLQIKHKDIEVENKHMDIKGEKEGWDELGDWNGLRKK